VGFTLFDARDFCSRLWGDVFLGTAWLETSLPLRQDLFAKNVLMTAQRNFCLGNRLLMIDD
jgi:hypothetical protein